MSVRACVCVQRQERAGSGGGTQYRASIGSVWQSGIRAQKRRVV